MHHVSPLCQPPKDHNSIHQTNIHELWEKRVGEAEGEIYISLPRHIEQHTTLFFPP